MGLLKDIGLGLSTFGQYNVAKALTKGGSGQEYSPYGARADFAETYAIDAFKELVGREPTAAELAYVVPIFQGSDPNIHDVGAGRAAVAEIARAEEQSPERVAERRRKELEAKAPEFYGSVDEQFQSAVGRAATEAERAHFGSLLASGELDQYTLGQFLTQLPEAVTSRDKAFQEQQRGELQQADTQYFQDQLLPSIQQSLLKAGRSTESSGYASALAQAAKQQAANREGYLTNLSADLYRGRTGAARQDYTTALSRLYGTQDYNLGRSAQLQDAAYNRLSQLQDYNIQRNTYEDYLRRYGKRSSGQGIGSLVGGLLGAGLGATQGPQGAYYGYSAGSGLGGGIGSFF